MPLVYFQCDLSPVICDILLDHGALHLGIPTIVKNAYILICNVSMKREKETVALLFQSQTAG